MEVKALSEARQEEGAAGVHVLLDHQEQVGSNVVHPLAGGEGGGVGEGSTGGAEVQGLEFKLVIHGAVFTKNAAFL